MLGERGGEIVQRGGVAIEVVEQGSSYDTPATREDVERWVETFDLAITTVHPADGALEQLEGRDHTYVVDLETMEIVFETGYGDGPEDAIDDVLGRLGG